MSMMLTTVEFASLVLVVEFGLAALLGPILILRRKQRDTEVEKAEVTALIEEVEAKVPSRREALATIFESTYNLEGDELANKVSEFVDREQAFYQVMTSVYLERDGERLKDLPDELTKVISPWIRLTPSNMVDSSAVDELEAENGVLHEELGETRRNMEELMAEYVAAFNKAQKLAAQSDESAETPVVAHDQGDVDSENAPVGEIPIDLGDCDDAPAVAEDPLVAEDPDRPERGETVDVSSVNDAQTEEADGPVAYGDDEHSTDIAGTEAEEAHDRRVDPDAAPVLSIDVSADEGDELSKADLDALFAQDLEPPDDKEQEVA